MKKTKIKIWGGQREGAGRKVSEDKKLQVQVGIKTSVVAKIGGLKPTVNFIKGKIDSHYNKISKLPPQLNVKVPNEVR